MTIPLDPRFIAAFSIETVLLDKDTGAPLSGGQVFFEEDNQRGILKPVYQITGTSPNYTFIQLPNPITLSSIGTFEDALGNPVVPYFFPYDSEGNPDYYYIAVYSSGGVPQFDREAVPYLGSENDADVLSVITNELSNPQFSQVNFDTTVPSVTYSVNAVSNQVISIAPSWDLVVTAPAAGTVTVAQLTPFGTLNIPTNPGTILNISSTGMSQLLLRQRLYGSPNLWGSGFLSSSFVAKTYSGTPVTLSMFYSQSNGSVVSQQFLPAAQLPSSGNYEVFQASTALIPASNSPDTFPNAYIDIYFQIPVSIEIDITSVMVAYTGNVSIDNVNYDQESESRQIDHLFHYYQPQLNFKPVPSLLTGWDFPLNPAQFGSTQTITTTPKYIWDQTICASVVGNITANRVGTTGDFAATTANANEAFYMMQYLTGADALKTTFSQLSVNIEAYSANNPGVKVQVYLFYSNGGGAIPTLPTTIGTLAASGVFTLTAANWAAIPQPNMNQSSGTLALTFPNQDDISLSGWNGEAYFASSSTANFAIVVTFSAPTSGTIVVVESISLTPGDIPTRPAPQQGDQVVRECRRYYEQSYKGGGSSNPAGSVTAENALFMDLTALNPASSSSPGTAGAMPAPFSLQFIEPKRTEPTMTFYSPRTGTINVINANLYYITVSNTLGTNNADVAVVTFWTTNIGTKSVNFTPASFAVMVSGTSANTINFYAAGGAYFHYVADSRLGIV